MAGAGAAREGAWLVQGTVSESTEAATRRQGFFLFLLCFLFGFHAKDNEESFNDLVFGN